MYFCNDCNQHPEIYTEGLYFEGLKTGTLLVTSCCGKEVDEEELDFDTEINEEEGNFLTETSIEDFKKIVHRDIEFKKILKEVLPKKSAKEIQDFCIRGGK